MSNRAPAKTNNTLELEALSRRQAFSLLGITAALSVALPATVLTVSDANAQTPGMERREDRRTTGNAPSTPPSTPPTTTGTK